MDAGHATSPARDGLRRCSRCEESFKIGQKAAHWGDLCPETQASPQASFTCPMSLPCGVPCDSRCNSGAGAADYLASLPADTPVKVEVGAIGGQINATFTEEDGFCVNEDQGCEEE